MLNSVCTSGHERQTKHTNIFTQKIIINLLFVMITQAMESVKLFFIFCCIILYIFITEYVFTNPVSSRFRVLFLVTYKWNYGNLCKSINRN